ncbi:hypothetical protein OROMI_032903 [Orobanche minor]
MVSRVGDIGSNPIHDSSSEGLFIQSKTDIENVFREPAKRFLAFGLLLRLFSSRREKEYESNGRQNNTDEKERSSVKVLAEFNHSILAGDRSACYRPAELCYARRVN